MAGPQQRMSAWPKTIRGAPHVNRNISEPYS